MPRYLAVIVLCFATSALAEPPPWAVGVTDEQKATAKRQLEAGNALFVEHRYADALDAYRAAVAAWDHPAIRFNIVRCEIQLDDPIAAADDLSRALAYGAAPLEDAVYSEALAYQKLLANQIGELEARCDRAGVKVTLDGKPFGACPGSERRRLRVGDHQLVAVEPGFVTLTRDLVVRGGRTEAVHVVLVPVAKAARVTRRWATWKPWLVFGAGLGVAAIGGAIDLKASSDMATYDRQVALVCAGGCPANRVDDALRRSAVVENRAAIGAVAVGAAAAAFGGVLLYMNRARTEYPSIEPRAGGMVVGVTIER